MSDTKLKWNEQPHTHICPLHNERSICKGALPCPDKYVLVCEADHSRELIQWYVTETNRRHNEEIREEQRGQRQAYAEGREDARDHYR